MELEVRTYICMYVCMHASFVTMVDVDVLPGVLMLSSTTTEAFCYNIL
jgi:hypothetical protein